MRGSGSAAKIRKDLRQAEQVFQTLLELRPTDITLALQAASDKGTALQGKFQAGLDRLDSEIAAEVLKLA